MTMRRLRSLLRDVAQLEEVQRAIDTLEHKRNKTPAEVRMLEQLRTGADRFVAQRERTRNARARRARQQPRVGGRFVR